MLDRDQRNLLEDNAEKIAKIIGETDSDYCGILFDLIAYNLRNHFHQCYTGGLFDEMAEGYGMPPGWGAGFESEGNGLAE